MVKSHPKVETPIERRTSKNTRTEDPSYAAIADPLREMQVCNDNGRRFNVPGTACTSSLTVPERGLLSLAYNVTLVSINNCVGSEAEVDGLLPTDGASVMRPSLEHLHLDT